MGSEWNEPMKQNKKSSNSISVMDTKRSIATQYISDGQASLASWLSRMGKSLNWVFLFKWFSLKISLKISTVND